MNKSKGTQSTVTVNPLVNVMLIQVNRIGYCTDQVAKVSKDLDDNLPFLSPLCPSPAASGSVAGYTRALDLGIMNQGLYHCATGVGHCNLLY